jgi:Zn-dependent protease with chaperone function
VTVLAHYYDGRSAKRREVALTLEGEVVHVQGDGIDRIGTLHDLRISEPMGEAPRLVTFPDGAFCEVRDHAGLKALLQQTGHRDHLIVRWQFSLRWIAASTMLCVAFFAAAYVWGLPWLAKHLAEEVPDSMARAISDQALDSLDQSLAAPSELPVARQEEIIRSFDRMRPPGGQPVPHRIVFRSSKALRANALALPSGTIVVTDGLVRLAQKDEELLGVLAHELGHVRARHGLRMMLQSSIVGLVTAWYIGDVSSILAAAPAVLLQANYSRDFEREADAYAVAMLRANGMPPARMADLLERLETSRHAGAPAGDDAASAIDYLSSHPATAERLRALREASGGKP